MATCSPSPSDTAVDTAYLPSTVMVGLPGFLTLRCLVGSGAQRPKSPLNRTA
ncbi:Uncharacterised protein [Mycobacterium tuberculosis]|uniref:Uncharacterized protein n=1 Tax=Mycobacterium tuberculosis TaxID=1773 RepID=A0A0U0TDK9_MYCTX|nr:Uncharacterised protein [Mycobacterium tuberculosis]COY69387.1 Uncharacterised protein [Mycobacterium tuberculosis]